MGSLRIPTHPVAAAASAKTALLVWGLYASGTHPGTADVDESMGYLFFDATGNGSADGVVKLAGVAEGDLVFGDIMAG